MLAVLGGVASEALDLTGFYYSGKAHVVKRKSTQLSRTSTARYHAFAYVHVSFAPVYGYTCLIFSTDNSQLIDFSFLKMCSVDWSPCGLIV